METLNQTLFLMINAGADPLPWLLHLGLFAAKWLVFFVPLALLAAWLWGDPRWRTGIVTASVAVVLGLAVVWLVRWSWPHPRPFVVGLGSVHLEHVPDASFPSNHATFCFTIALTLLLNGVSKIGWPIFLIGVLVSWARIFLGVHFPFDMVGACLVAAAMAVVSKRLLAVGGAGARLLMVLEGRYRRVLAIPIAKGWIVA